MCSVERNILKRPRRFKIASLFSGIGGFELGLRRAGHDIAFFCENNRDAQRVLLARFPGTPVRKDVLQLRRLPREINLVTAGFPCQDLSPAGRTKGISGQQSRLVHEVFRLIDTNPESSLLLENVPFMLRLGRGEAIRVIVQELEARAYRWAYRVIDARAFGVPQRRPRVFLLACRHDDPREVLFADGVILNEQNGCDSATRSHGFYWTEGNRGIGWAVDSIPALKGGSGVGIPSAPAMILPSGEICTPHLCDAERLQGFPANWTAPAARESAQRHRWKLIGNAVNVRVAEWIGRRLARPGKANGDGGSAMTPAVWPNAAYNIGEGRRSARVGSFPVRYRDTPLHEFLRFPPKPLSRKAAAGILRRLRGSSLRVDEILFHSLEAHLVRLERQD